MKFSKVLVECVRGSIVAGPVTNPLFYIYYYITFSLISSCLVLVYKRVLCVCVCAYLLLLSAPSRLLGISFTIISCRVGPSLACWGPRESSLSLSL